MWVRIEGERREEEKYRSKTKRLALRWRPRKNALQKGVNGQYGTSLQRSAWLTGRKQREEKGVRS